MEKRHWWWQACTGEGIGVMKLWNCEPSMKNFVMVDIGGGKVHWSRYALWHVPSHGGAGINREHCANWVNSKVFTMLDKATYVLSTGLTAYVKTSHLSRGPQHPPGAYIQLSWSLLLDSQRRASPWDEVLSVWHCAWCWMFVSGRSSQEGKCIT